MSKKLNILYAEDDTTASETLSNILSNFDFIDRIDVANDGLEALNLFNENKDYDVLISDIKMPYINGIELISTISKKRKMHTIITTAFDENQYLKDAIELGVDKFISKPIDINNLIQNLESYYKGIIKEMEFEHQKSLLEMNSKLITMGEMIDSIAHQWSQPLAIIGLENSSNEILLEQMGIKDEDIFKSIENINLNVRHLHDTLSNFRTFVRPDKQKEKFWVSEYINKALKILVYPIKMNRLEVAVNIIEDFEIEGFPNQFSHIIINLINNSKDAFNDNNLEDRQIKIKVLKNEIVFTDNAGGIPENIIDNIFEQNVSSKDYGTGIGMYMSQKIAFNNGCKITVINIENGALFKVSKFI